MIDMLKAKHFEIFEKTPNAYYFSPGQINLIGDYTDYGGGHVLSMALEQGIYASVSARTDSTFQLHVNHDAKTLTQSVTLNHLQPSSNLDLIDHFKGVLAKFKHEGHTLETGLDIHVDIQVPINSGLAETGALQMLFITLINQYYRFNVDPLKLAKYARYINQSYFKLPMTIKEAYLINFAQTNHVINIDTKVLQHEQVPFSLKNHTLVTMLSNVRRPQLESDHTDRIQSIDLLTKHFRKHRMIDKFCDVSIDDFNLLKGTLNNQKLLQHAEHILFENRRAVQASEALKDADYTFLGELMNQSHASLKHLLNASCDELEYLIEANRELGALGAKMVPSKQSGTLIVLYHNQTYPASFEELIQSYERIFNKNLDIIDSKPFQGAHQIVMKE